jgi:hypothetical protein
MVSLAGVLIWRPDGKESMCKLICVLAEFISLQLGDKGPSLLVDHPHFLEVSNSNLSHGFFIKPARIVGAVSYQDGVVILGMTS